MRFLIVSIAILRSKTRAVAFLFGALLIYGCGGDETMDNPVAETIGSESFNIVTLDHFPIAVGNRWVYRNPDGTEWTREITNAKVIGDLRYHLSSHNPANNAR